MQTQPTDRPKKAVLAIDGNPTSLRFMQEVLKGEYKIHSAPSGALALEFLSRKTVDLVLLDLQLPDLDGYEVLLAVRDKAIPVIVVTAQEGQEAEQEAFRLGAADYVVKPVSAGVINARVKAHLELADYKRDLERMVDIRTAQLRRTQDSILEMLCNVTAYKDNETGAHLLRTTLYMKCMADFLVERGRSDYLLTREQADDIVKTCKLHDIGKVAVPDSLLHKPGSLTEVEFALVKKHTVLGAKIIDDAIEGMGQPPQFLHAAREIILCHHENWDGTGYPQGLKGPEIPLSCRMMAIADSYDALVSERPYKAPLSHEESVKGLLSVGGTELDPVLLELAGDGGVFADFARIVQEYPDQDYPMKMLYV